MKKKVGTMLDEDLVYEAKQVALSQKEPFSKLLEDALRLYLLTIEKKNGLKKKDISRSTQGAMGISLSVLKKIMEEEGVCKCALRGPSSFNDGRSCKEKPGKATQYS